MNTNSYLRIAVTQCQPQFMLLLTCVTLGLFGVSNASIAADSPPSALPNSQTPILFKDLTPPELQGHGEGHAAAHDAIQSVCDEGGFSGAAEYLLMRPRRGLFDYAIRDPNRNLVPEGELASLNYSLRSGVRAGITYRVPESAWDIQTAYTYFRSNARGEEFAPAGGTLYATLTRPGLNDEVTVARASANLEYNVFDTVVGRRFALD